MSLPKLSSLNPAFHQGEIALQKLVLRLAFSEPLPYHRLQGYRTPKTTLPFSMLGGNMTPKEVMVRAGGLEPPLPKENGF